MTWPVVPVTVLSYATGWVLGVPWLVPVLNALASYPFMVLALKRGNLRLAVARMLAWALTMGLCATAMSYARPWEAGALFLRASAYRAEMFTWVLTGAGRESTPSQFIPQQLGQTAVFIALAVGTGGILAMPMGAVLMNDMGAYAGSLAAASARPGPTALLAWHPWAVIRIAAFVVLGVVLSVPVLSRLARLRVDGSTARALMAWAAGGLVADVVLKALAAPAWQRLLQQVAGW